LLRFPQSTDIVFNFPSSPLKLLSLLFLLLVSCETFPLSPVASSSRNSQLKALGYVPLQLQKVSGDSRYSGRFKVNKSPVHLLIDSGANSTDIDADLGKAAGVRIDRNSKVVSRGALGRPITSHIGIGSFTAGPITISPFAYSLAPPSENKTATSRYHGQLGLDAISKTSALLDLQSGSMWLPDRNARNKKGNELVPLGIINNLAVDAVPLESAGRLPHLVYQGRYNGQQISWIVDTGAEVTVLAETTARRLNIPTRRSQARIIDASGDNAPVKIGLMRNIHFGAIKVSEFEVAVTNLKIVRENFKDNRGRPIDGIIGMDFLEKSHALLDSKSRILYLGPSD